MDFLDLLYCAAIVGLWLVTAGMAAGCSRLGGQLRGRA